MKIKKFENFISPEGNLIYYTLHIDGSWDKFLIALDKLGIKKDFLNNWNIKGIEDLENFNVEYFKKDIILLLKEDGHYYIRNTIDKFGKILNDYEKVINGGDIYIEDWEVAANKYNL